MRRIRLRALPRPPGAHHQNLIPQASLFQQNVRNSKLRNIIGSPLISPDCRNPEPVAEDDLCIHLFQHFRSNRVLYSRSRNLNPQVAHEQLTFYGKKTVPGITRIEISRTPPQEQLDRKALKKLKKDPIVITEAGTRKDLWKPMATIKFAEPELAELAFQKLRDLRLLRDYSWKQIKLPVPLNMRERRHWLQDQRGSSVADVATTVEHINHHILKRRDRILEDWKRIKLLAKSALDGKLEETECNIARTEESIKTKPTFAEKRLAVQKLVDLQSKRYRMLRALKVVHMVNNGQQPEHLEDVLRVQMEEEKRLKDDIAKCERKLEKYRAKIKIAQEMLQEEEDEARSQDHALALATSQRNLGRIHEKRSQLLQELEVSKERQTSTLQSIESLARTDDTSITMQTGSHAVVSDAVLNNSLTQLVQNVVQLHQDGQLDQLSEEDINRDFGVTIYWGDINDRKYWGEWPENIIHKPMGLRPFNMRFVASLPSHIEDFILDEDEFIGNDGIDESINVLPTHQPSKVFEKTK